MLVSSYIVFQVKLCFVSFSAAYPGPVHGGNSLTREIQLPLTPPGGTPKHSKASRELLSLQRVLGLPWGNTSQERRPGDILTRCLNNLNWLLSTRRSSGSTLSLSRISKLLTLSLRLSSVTLQRKLISAACICDSFSHYPELMTIGESWDID